MKGDACIRRQSQLPPLRLARQERSADRDKMRDDRGRPVPCLRLFMMTNKLR